MKSFSNLARVIKRGDYKLIPAKPKDLDFILDLALAEKYCVLSREQLRDGYLAHTLASWVCCYKGKALGVAMVSKILVPTFNMEFITFDAYEVPTKNESSSVACGKLLIEWIWKKGLTPLWTAHDIRNRAATIACLRLGFRKHSEVYGNIVMRRD